MHFPIKPRASALGPKLALTLALLVSGFGGASAADLDYAPRAPIVVPRARVVTAQNPWCRIVPGPQHDLFGDTHSFRPMAVCYSAGVLADSYDYGR